MIELLIIADDFTGALDTGVQFSKKNIPTMVTTSPEPDLKSVPETVRVLVADIESRHLSPEEAARRVENIVIRARDYGVGFYYKKTDSTLRGNIGSELAALMKSGDASGLAFIPAYPKTKRTTVNGCQYVEGVPIHETVFAKDPLNPINDCYIPDILQKQSEVAAAIVRKEELAGWVENGKSGPGIEKEKKIIYIFDASGEEDMETIGAALQRAGMLSFTAGCAGFAELLPELLGMRPVRGAPGHRAHPGAGAPEKRKGILAVCGSVNERSLAQVRYAQTQGFKAVILQPEEKLDENFIKTEKGRQWAEKISEYIRSGTDVVVKSVDSREEAEACGKLAADYRLEPEQLPLAISRNLGRLIKGILDCTVPENLVVFGGDTAVSILEAMGCDGMMAQEEIAPGIAVCTLPDGRYAMNIITKAGGFGTEKVLPEIKNYVEAKK